MSVFSKIRRGRQAAKEHSVKQAERQKAEEDEKPKYRHVPTHAATDALTGAPPGWRVDDRPRILEENRRRSAMVASGIGMSVHMGVTPFHSMGLPRVQSSLSHVAYPKAYANPVVQLPRNYSYSGVHPGWIDRGADVIYSHSEPGGSPAKGKTVEGPGGSSRASRTSKANSPVGSSGASTGSSSSQDDLEMKPVSRRQSAALGSETSEIKQTRSAGEVDYVHHLHPAQIRRVSQSPPSMPADDRHLPQLRTNMVLPRPGVSRASTAPSLSPPGIPPVPTLPPMQFGTALSTPAAIPSAMPTFSAAPSAAPPASSASAARQSWMFSSAQSFKSTPRTVLDPILRPEQTDLSPPAAPAPSQAQKSRRLSKTPRFAELETINSNTSSSATVVPSSFNRTSFPTTTTASVPASPDEFVFSAPTAVPEVTPPTISASKPANKLSKKPQSKLVKKNRWSMAKNAVAV